jgi:hypothetical protein
VHVFVKNSQRIFGAVGIFRDKRVSQIFFFEKYEISHQAVVFVEKTTQIPKSGDKHGRIPFPPKSRLI